MYNYYFGKYEGRFMTKKPTINKVSIVLGDFSTSNRLLRVYVRVIVRT